MTFFPLYEQSEGWYNNGILSGIIPLEHGKSFLAEKGERGS
jgi:hypothetical protein